MFLLKFTKIKMLRTTALICILSICVQHSTFSIAQDLETKNIIDIFDHEFGKSTEDTTSSNVPITSDKSNECTNLRCEQQCAAPATPEPSTIIIVKILQDRQCSCSCCGYRKTPVGKRILNDGITRSIPNQYPWIVAILKIEEELGIRSYDYKCVGSLIHPSVVLTAAHCISKIKPSKLIVRVGEHDTSMLVENNNQANIQVDEFIIHEHYSDYGYDIALMFLKGPATINANVSTICMPPPNANFDSKRCLVSGWGKNSIDGEFQTTLRTVYLPIVPRDECITSLRTTELGEDFELSDSMICAGGEANKDTCEGDGGAPLVCKIDGTTNQYHQVGIVAWGVGCGGTIPAAYTDVAKFRNWIDEKLRIKNLSY